jgi:hypothetical protein
MHVHESFSWISKIRSVSLTFLPPIPPLITSIDLSIHEAEVFFHVRCWWYFSPHNSSFVTSGCAPGRQWLGWIFPKRVNEVNSGELNECFSFHVLLILFEGETFFPSLSDKLFLCSFRISLREFKLNDRLPVREMEIRERYLLALASKWWMMVHGWRDDKE